MIFIGIVFILLLFVLVMQYFQFKDKKKPIPIFFLSLFLAGIIVVFFIQKNMQSLDIHINSSWLQTTIFFFLGIIFVSILILIYIYFKSNRQHTKIDKFWLYQSFLLVVLLFVGLVYVYYQQNRKIELKENNYQQSIFVKNSICYADSFLLNPINYIVVLPQKTLQMKIRSMDMVYRFSIRKPQQEIILIPEKIISLPISFIQDTIYFFVE